MTTEIDGDSFETDPTTVTNTESPYTTTGEQYIYADTSGGAVTITLASADTVDGKEIRIIDSGTNAATNNVTINTEGGESINPGGNASITLSVDGTYVDLFSDGTNWFSDRASEKQSVSTEELVGNAVTGTGVFSDTRGHINTTTRQQRFEPPIAKRLVQTDIDASVGSTPNSITTADLDDDGLVDVIVGDTAGNVYWYEQGSAPSSWTQHTISTTESVVEGITAADFDNDGQVELAWVDQQADTVSVAQPDSTPSGTWSTEVLATGKAMAQDIESYDVNGDGVIDLVYSYEGDNDGEGGVNWVEYNGGTLLSASNWTDYLVKQIDRAWKIRGPVDYSLNGVREDIVVSSRTRGDSWASGKLVWLEPGGDPTTEWSEHVIHDGGDQDSGYISIGELSGSGESKDILSVPVDNGGGVYWYKYPDWERTEISSNTVWENVVTIPRDGRDDFAGIFDSGIVLKEYNGTWDTVDTSGATVSKNADAFPLHDLNGNGYLDLITIGQSNNTVSWFQYDWDGGYAKIYPTATSQSVPDSAFTYIEFDAVSKDQRRWADLANNELSITEDGEYMIGGVVTLDSVGDGTRMVAEIEVGGNRITGANNSSGTDNRLSVPIPPTPVDISADTDVKLRCFQDSGVSKSVIQFEKDTNIWVRQFDR